MKVGELLALLHDLPVEALEKDIYIDNDREQFKKAAIAPVTESCEDDTIIGYVLVEVVEEDPRQVKLPFNGQ